MTRSLSFYLLSITFLLGSCNQNSVNNEEINSPNDKLSINFKLTENGEISYSVFSEKEELIRDSKLGYKLKSGVDLTKDFKIVKIEKEEVNKTWDRIWGESKTVLNKYNESKVFLENNKGYKLNVFLRAYDDGVAFRYEIPNQEKINEFVIIDEKSEFALNNIEEAWWIWADFDTYEKLYNKTSLDSATWVATPSTFKTATGKFLSIHEANLTDYAGMTLKLDSLGVYESYLVPWANGDKVRANSYLISPWRSIQVSDKAVGLINSNLIVNLNDENKIEDTSWIKPISYIGIWWGMHIGTETWTEGERHGANTDNAIRYIDFAKKNNIDGVVIEGWNKGWDKWGEKDAFDHITSANDFDLEKVANHAYENDIYLIGHNETGGDIESYERFMPEAFSTYEKLKIRALKTGYAGGIYPRGEHHHGQMMVNHYRKVVELAAKHKIVLDVHEPIKATGIRRTWPNMMTREGVKGMEWNAWSSGNPPNHTLILPFTRGLGGPIDYTPGMFDVEIKNFANDRISWNTDDISETRIHTTLSKQLALLVILYSPMQMASDVIDNYEGVDAFSFVSELKTTWDESIVLNGEIGEYITVARKSGEQWFVASATNEIARETSIKLDFLESGKNYEAVIYRDADGIDWQNNPSEYVIEKIKVNSTEDFKFNLVAGGGYAIIINQL